MKQYDFIVMNLIPYPEIIKDSLGFPINFNNRELANDFIKVHNYLDSPIIIDIKKLQSEKEIDDMAANVGW